MNKVIIGAFADEAGGRLDDQIAAMLDNGVKHLEARMVDGKNFVDCTAEEARAIKAKLDANDLRIWSIGSPLGKINITDPMEPHLDKLKHTLELAAIMGSERIRMFSFFIPEGEDPAVYRDEVMERLSRMVEVAAGSGVKLCHENEKGIYGDVAVRCKDILDSVPGLGGIFDPANFIQCGQNTLEAWDLLKDRIDYFHVKDCLEDGKVVPCGKGIGHVPEILSKFIAAGGQQLTVEPHLTVFDGFAALEKDGAKTKMDAFAYPSKRAAFDAAVAALKESLV
ncbi:MAG: sugar phosphate isomerase/epimerase [Ruminococcaceae bacterium]|nr:sugar phosphate isomerase/epimerase [Oscillospiraceae bacterium]